MPKKFLFLLISLATIALVLHLYRKASIFFHTPKQGEKPHYDINNCEAAVGETWYDDYAVSNRILCYEERADKLNDWEACFHSTSPGSCLYRVSIKMSTYLCDKSKDKSTVSSCNYTLLSYGKEKIHSLEGIDKYKINKTIRLKSGDNFLLNPVSITKDGRIEFFSQSLECCKQVEEPPLAINTVAGGPNYIFITNCKVEGNYIEIIYFKYNFAGLAFPEGV